MTDCANTKRGSEVQAKRGGDRAKRPLETGMPGPKNMIREVRHEEEGAAHGEYLVQLTESAGVVDVDDEFSWSWDFNRRVCRGDGS